ncbi:MAG: nucleoside 2-deoxyribosyltransferase [Ktedonobacterales bacterium]
MRSNQKNRVYFAAPLFTQAEKQFNEALADELEASGFDVFLPQRDGIVFTALGDMSPEEKSKRVYELDVREVEEAQVVVAVLDGRVPDEGVCVEIAIACEHRKLTGKRKQILGLKTDTRVLLPGADLNPMIAGNLDAIFRSCDDLLAYLRNQNISAQSH